MPILIAIAVLLLLMVPIIIYNTLIAKKNMVLNLQRNIFEPNIFSSILNFDLIREYYEDLQLATGIVDDLNLNTRIWSRQ